MNDTTSVDEGHDWTVIGFWADDTPVVVGVVAGEHDVDGGDDCSDLDIAGSFRGPWATSVTASSVEDAEAAAVQEMLAEDREQYFE